MTDTTDKKFMKRAIALALASEREGNLPVGAVLALDGEPIGEGKSSVLVPEYDPGRHAEIEAIRRVEKRLWPRAAEMTCYTTLEPCVMCAGTLLLHGVGRVVFGANDTLGGAGCMLAHLPAYYDEGGVFEWVGPTMPQACDPLYERADEAFSELPVGRARWARSMSEYGPVEQERVEQERVEHNPIGQSRDESPSAKDHLETLDTWRATPTSMSIREARKAASSFADQVDDELVAEVLPYAMAIFERTGYLKDFRSLKRLAKRAGQLEILDEVGEAIREHLPDVWIKRALKQGDLDGALACWYEHEGHRRSRLCADELVRACAQDDAELLISCRMSEINYLIGRRARRHYRRACTVLRRLRDELEQAGHADYWRYVVEDIRTENDNRPALIDELEKAGFADDRRA